MMDKEIFRKTEQKLRNYFSKDKKVNGLKYKIIVLNKQIQEIDEKIKNVDISIPEESVSISYGEKVQSSMDCTSYAEKAVIRITDNLLNERTRKLIEIADIEEEVRNIEADNIIIESNMKNLDEEDKEFLKTKYGKQITDWKVGLIFNMSQSKVTRKKQKLVRDISKWEAFVIIN